MFRKIILGVTALAAIGAATFTITATPAGAAPFNHHRHDVWRPAVRFYGAPVNYGSCYVRRVIPTPFGPRVEWINRCY
jgi:hypothetical protein